MPSPTTVHLVPHTHWDREWYLPFQAFRMRLVGLLDELLQAMEADDRLRFTLDGQLATVDDYLEIRPEATDRLAALVRSGRLAVGPWLILMDEFLVSGETIVRNLEMGTRRATELGRVMAVGYLPDMFGHIAQMPQILRRAGIDAAVVWRGVPEAIDRHAFTWRSPDGSAVRTEYLWRGYGNARDLFDDPDRIDSKLRIYVEGVAALFGAADILAMYGEDHSIPLQGYADLVDRFNAGQDRFRIEVATLGAYLAETRDQGEAGPAWDGELRSSARANILMGVVSNRVDVRAAAATAERLLWRTAEPLLAIHGAGSWPDRYLELAARRIVENSAHDSICACSLDPVVEQVLVRFAEASQIATGLADGTLRGWADALPRGAWAVFNPSPVRRSDLVEVDLPVADADGRSLLGPAGQSIPTQELARSQRTFDERDIASVEVGTYLSRRIHGRELYARQVNGWTLDGPERRVLTIHVDRVPDPAILDIDALLVDVARAADADSGATWRLRVIEGPRRTVLARVEAPGLGLTSVGPVPAAGVGPATDTDRGAPVTTSDRSLDNGLLSVTIADDGTVALTGAGRRLSGIGRLVDGGDVGDTYNYAPPPDDTLVDQPMSVGARMVEAGPLRGVVEVERRYRWPEGLAPDLGSRSGESVEVLVTTRVELRMGEPFVRLTLAYDNRATDHRLRLHVPLAGAVDRSFAEGQFAIVERGLTAEAGHGEYPLPTRPADAFVAAGGLAVLARHIVEYELVGDGGEVAITLLRATGLISRDDHPWRDEPAGPVLPTPGAQLPGPRMFELAVLPFEGERPGPEVPAAAEAFRHPFICAAGGGSSDAPLLERPGLTIDGPGVILSSLRRRDGWLEARIVAECRDPVSARLRGSIAEAREADILGRPGRPLPVADGVLRLELGPWEIRTVQLRTEAG
jgi:alpha-mannosidase